MRIHARSSIRLYATCMGTFCLPAVAKRNPLGGWGAADPTAGMGCDSRYIPLFHSNDGMIDLVHTSDPRITIVSER